MVAINTNPGQDEELPAWREKGHYTFPILLSGDREFADTTYGVFGTPTNLVLNADGKLVFRHVGYRPGSEKTVEAEIRELLGLDPFAGIEPAKTNDAAKK
jgi:hypothetical protein